MNLLGIIRLIIRHYKLLFLLPLVTAITAYFLLGEQKVVYQSKVVIYTGIASGYSIESIEGVTYNNYKTNNAFDNLINIIKARKTIQETALKLLATDLSLTKANPWYLSAENFESLMKKVPAEVKRVIVPNDGEKTLENITKLYKSSDTNYVYRLLNSPNPYYGIKAIEGIVVKRVLTSDLIEVSYNSDDPGICRHTLEILAKVLIENYSTIFKDQTVMVIKWFEEQVTLSEKRLKDAEDRLLEFNSGNNIINYYEQTKFIAMERELLDREAYSEQKEYMAAEAAKNELERKLGIKDHLFQTSNSIIVLRNELSEILSQIVILESEKSRNQAMDDRIKELRAQADSIKNKFSETVSQLFTLQNTIEGVPVSMILTEWLAKMMKYEESKAKLKALGRRQTEFQQKYATFAPLGATLKRIEREIGVCEQDYMERLHGLNLAKLREQNIELSNNIKVIDQPVMPKSGKTVSNKLVALIAFIVGFILVLTVLILLEIFDSTIKSAARAEAIIGLKVVGIFPSMKSLAKNPQKELILKRLIDVAIRNTFFKQLTADQGLKIAFVSTRAEEGKNMIASLFANRLLERQIECSLFAPLEKGIEQDKTHVLYNPNNPNELNSMLGNNPGKHLLIEVPSLIMNDYPSELISTFDLVFLVCRASREWNKADQKTLDRFVETTGKTPEIILNGTDIYQLETVFGEVPIHRSKLRRYIKKLLALNFFGSKNI